MTEVNAPKPLRDQPSSLGRALEATARKAEQVNPAARARVWKKLAGPADRWHAKHLWIAGATALAAAFAMIFWASTPRGSPRAWRLEEIAGEVRLEGSSSALQPGSVLPEGSRLRIGDAGAAVISEGTVQVALAPGTTLRLDPLADLQLEQGMAAVRILGERRFTIAAGAYTLRASTGVFVAEVSSSRVRVRAEGAPIAVDGPGGGSVARGSSWTSEAGDKDDLVAPAQLINALEKGSALQRLAMLHPAGPGPAASGGIGTALLAQAHADESAKDYAGAAASYARLAEFGGARAPAALYELARLRLKFLGQPQGALDALEQARSRYPANPLAQEVALSAIDARLAVGHDDATLSEMDLFLEKYSSSERAAEVRWLRASLEVRAGDCQAAGSDLSLLARDPVQGANALLGEAVCARRRGDESSARAALRGYLRRYPDGAHRREAQAAASGATLELP
jgi:hypothetical protein